ncbi:alpha-D-ribose 1-methylphosphonate 5-triphosphate synthase subunit PhnH [Variibacter gotjawalensis]|uniref:Alpha-D-ribose 1-methylphosphonate 5-triphosphate synthase subunit PhnH n=1 Tax=Variibacter gotjawalensis TaxID=1333996 RepID=A0A0S3PT41_9BRAD|nr:phosphonate C-P lyase system protein PhnH [Variibacter gotjawalensis]NIK49429.1 alpha-D-ribose 1-methylphosphonate 5-triphosphate synthase subunit PhnH [Variibacter gotjawalensis]RZS51281.1 alpha-D-ribose 1-methylphosphonate 5-triphosphate synthase subunit PhnH [Variibacter gotjawalensis]BAT59114.1 alpha-D-ribose 1-methylphosphonate 5-triphosphate synthase subunit PhnH [Variibacter gotjawalensis]
MNIAAHKGFADPVIESQRVFRAVMNALARPGSVQSLQTNLAAPFPLTPTLAAVALALADQDAPVWLDQPLRETKAVAEFLRFHTGAPIVDNPSESAFALVSAADRLPPLDQFAFGTPAFPDRSTTIVLPVGALGQGAAWILSGPGIAGETELRAGPLPDDFAEQWTENNALFPRGVDLILAAPGSVAALSRTTKIVRRA